MSWNLIPHRNSAARSRSAPHPDKLTLREAQRIARGLGASLALGLVAILWMLDKPSSGEELAWAALAGLALAIVVYLVTFTGVMVITRVALWSVRRFRERRV